MAHAVARSDGDGVVEEWKRRFEETGEVAVRASRRGAMIGFVAALGMFALSVRSC